MCGRLFGIFFSIPELATHHFVMPKKHSRLFRLRLASGNIHFPPPPAFCLRCWCEAVCCYRKKYSSGVRRSDRLCRHSGSGRFLPPSSWQRRTPSAHYQAEPLAQKRIVGPYDRSADSENHMTCTGLPGHYGIGRLPVFHGSKRRLGTCGTQKRCRLLRRGGPL